MLDPTTAPYKDAYLIHGSHAGGVTRRVGLMRYMPTTVKATNHPGHKMYLDRGRDRAGSDYGDPAKVKEKWLGSHFEERLLVDASRR